MNIVLHVRNIAAALMVAVPLVNVYADTWLYEAEITAKEYSFGNVRVVLTQDATQNQVFPDFLLTIYRAEKEVGRYPGLAFQTLHASSDNKVFVGLSNKGIPGSAVIVFDASGTISLLAKHGLAEFDYCQKSVTIARTWYDDEDPDVEFKLDGKPDEQGIYVRSCRGTRIELLQTVAEAYGRVAANRARK